MAWAEKLPSGRWRGAYRDAQGKIRSAGTYPHKARAIREAAALESDTRKHQHRDLDAGKITWGQWCDQWWPTRNVEPGTLKRDASRRDHYLAPRWSDVPLEAITRQDVKAWAAQLRSQPGARGRPLSAASVQRIVHLFSASLVAAVDDERIGSNPAYKLKLPPAAPPSDRFLTHDEYERIHDAMETDADRLVLKMLANTGMRIGELSALHRHRLDLKRRRVRVAEAIDENEGVVKPYPKGKKVRTVPLPEWLADELAEVVARTPSSTCGVQHREGRCRSGLAVTTESGTMVRRSNFDDVFRRAVRRAKVDDASVHDLRHTYASWLLQDGVSLARVGQLLGHVSPLTTQRYAHLVDDRDDREVLAALPAPRLLHGARGSEHEKAPESA